jgi:hypothetical protein
MCNPHVKIDCNWMVQLKNLAIIYLIFSKGAGCVGGLHWHFRYLDIYHNRCVLTITLKIQHTMLSLLFWEH